MNSKEKILEILEEDSLLVNYFHHTAININQSGTLNQEKLEKEKRLFFRHATSYVVDDVVKETQSYPIDDISEVELHADFVVLKGRDFRKIKEFMEDLVNNQELKFSE